MAYDRWVGQVLGGRYKLEELLGQGGMSSVYKAYDPNLQRTVAIKLIHPHLSANDEFVRRFESEATSIARLRHPNIVQVYDFNHEADFYYMVLEFVAGETLQSRIKRLNSAGRSLPLRDVLHYTVDICRAAEYAHQRGLIHRDIKPANVMLNVSGEAILMDFGIARMLGGQAHTATGAVLGTAMYMSPEQIQGLHPDARSDIYSIGVMLFEALGGRPPFEADSVMTLMMMHLHDPVPDLANLRPDIPPAVKAIVNRALEKDRANRFQTCAEMADALQKASDALVEAAPAAQPSPELHPAATMIEMGPPPERAKTAAAPAPIPAAAPPVPFEATVIEAPAVPETATVIEPLSPLQATASAAEVQIPVPQPTNTVSAVPAAVPRVKQPGSARKAVLWVGLAVLLIGLAGGGYIFLKAWNPGKTPVPGGVAELPTTDTATATQLAATQTPLPPSETPAPSETPFTAPTATSGVLMTPLPLVAGADKLAYVVDNNIWVANIDGSDPIQLTSDGTGKKYLRWLPAGDGLTYISAKCLHTVDLNGATSMVTCFNNAEYFDAFEISPDGKRAAISVDRLLYLIPFDLQVLSTVNSHPELTAMADCKGLAPYQRNAAIAARWSRDGKRLTIIILGVLASGARGDIAEVIAVDRCVADPNIQIQFPQPHFTTGEYDRTPKLTSLGWDGASLFVITGLSRNDYFGEMHFFNWDTFKAQKSVNPINGVCCYTDVQFSPDGEYLLFAFQDIAQGKNSNTRYFYIPFGTIGSGATYQPLPLPGNSNPKEDPQLILRPAGLGSQPQANDGGGTGQSTSPSLMTVTPEPTKQLNSINPPTLTLPTPTRTPTHPPLLKFTPTNTKESIFLRPTSTPTRSLIITKIVLPTDTPTRALILRPTATATPTPGK